MVSHVVKTSYFISRFFLFGLVKHSPKSGISLFSTADLATNIRHELIKGQRQPKNSLQLCFSSAALSSLSQFGPQFQVVSSCQPLGSLAASFTQL